MKKHKKSAISLLLCAAMAASVGCSTQNESSTTAAVEEATPKNQSSLMKEQVASYGTAGTISDYDVENSHYQLAVDASDEIHDISDLLYGIFLEDINFAADGGLYAEMVKNRSFEFTKLASNNEKHGWSDVGTVSAQVTVDDAEGGLNQNNTNYMVLKNTSGTPAGVANEGFLDGMAVTENAGYTFSIYAKGLDGYTGALYVDITVDGESVASGKVDAITSEWQQYTVKLTSTKTASSNVKLQVTMDDGSAAIDMVSLFPEETYKNRENGLRKDLAEKLEALSPSFLRFPGGCVIEGQTLDTAYNWKDSIGVDENGDPLLFNGTYGDVAARSQGTDIWTDSSATDDPYPSFMTYGLGFYEYFQLAEDIGAIGVPVINCGLACLSRGNTTGPDLDSEEFDQYIQDMFDLIEFCRGDENTTWGAVRIAMGHTEPFALKYIGIGNEQWTDEFYERYEAFVEAFNQAKEENPEFYEGIELMYSAGVDDGDSGTHYMTAYEEAESYTTENNMSVSDFAGAVDHHYYNTPSWFLEHANYYDPENYSRSAYTDTIYGGNIPVFVGEYAAQSNTLEAALAEAAYMTGLERNSDIVVMAAYAPLFGNLTATHWAPDLIWFNNSTSTGSINYYVQQIFSKNVGTKVVSSNLTGAETTTASTLQGSVGVGTWNTAAYFEDVKIVNNDTGEVLGEQDFSSDTLSDWTKVSDGRWSISNGKLYQTSTSTDTGTYSTTGSAMYYGSSDWTNYTFTVKATKTSGDEGFLIPIAVTDKNNNYFWNIGGWGNTTSCLQSVQDGTKSEAIGGTSKDVTIETNQTYELKVVVTETNIQCYIDDVLYIDFTPSANAKAEAYQVVSTDDSGDIIIKLVNVTGNARTFAIDLANANIASDKATVEAVAGTSLSNDNILGQTEDCKLETTEVEAVSNQFNSTVSKYSVTVLRIKTQ